MIKKIVHKYYFFYIQKKYDFFIKVRNFIYIIVYKFFDNFFFI